MDVFKSMKILIVIPILEPQEYFFEKVIPRLKKQSVDCKILLINSGRKLRDDYGCMVIEIEKSSFNHADTRNLALRYEFDFYLFMTQDATPKDERLIENLLSAFVDDDVVVAYSRQVAYEDACICEKFARNWNYPCKSVVKSADDIKRFGIKSFFTSNSCCIYRGSFFRKLGGFRSGVNVSEDMEYAARAMLYFGKKVAYVSEAVVYHSHRYNLITIWKRYFEIGRFFKHNSWIEKSIEMRNNTQKSGFIYALEELRYVAKEEPLKIFKSFVYNGAKFIAFKMGRN